MTNSFSITIKRSDIHPKIAGANPSHAKTNITNLLRDSILGNYRNQMSDFEVKYNNDIDAFIITLTTNSTFDSTKQPELTSTVKKYLRDPNHGLQ